MKNEILNLYQNGKDRAQKHGRKNEIMCIRKQIADYIEGDKDILLGLCIECKSILDTEPVSRSLSIMAAMLSFFCLVATITPKETQGNLNIFVIVIAIITMCLLVYITKVTRKYREYRKMLYILEDYYSDFENKELCKRNIC